MRGWDGEYYERRYYPSPMTAAAAADPYSRGYCPACLKRHGYLSCKQAQDNEININNLQRAEALAEFPRVR